MAHVVVLCYHAVSPTWQSELAVTPEQLRLHVSAMLKRGFRPATFHDAVSAPSSKKTLAVTFDDGYRSMREHAYPVLSELGVPATVFMPTDFIGRDEPMSWPGVDGWLSTSDAHELLPMSWDDLRWLTFRGWEIGSHTCSHPYLPTTRDEDVQRELAASKVVLEEGLGRPCRSLAYPYGGLSARIVASARAAGYDTAAALWHPLRNHEPLTWPRVPLYRDDAAWRAALKLSVRLRQLRARLGTSAGRTPYTALGS